MLIHVVSFQSSVCSLPSWCSQELGSSSFSYCLCRIFSVVVVGRCRLLSSSQQVTRAIVSVTAGGDFGCVVLDDSTVKCWGDNSSGQLGHSTLNSTIPLRVSGLTGVVSLSLGYAYACALLTDGTVKCWGKTEYGQLGDGTTTDSSTPVVVTGLTRRRVGITRVDQACAVISGRHGEVLGFQQIWSTW
jgi:WD40 repeat protein